MIRSRRRRLVASMEAELREARVEACVEIWSGGEVGHLEGTQPCVFSGGRGGGQRAIGQLESKQPHLLSGGGCSGQLVKAKKLVLIRCAGRGQLAVGQRDGVLESTNSPQRSAHLPHTDPGSMLGLGNHGSETGRILILRLSVRCPW